MVDWPGRRDISHQKYSGSQLFDDCSILDMGDGDHDDLFHLLGMWHQLTSNIWTKQSTMKLVVFGTGLLKLFLQSPHLKVVW